MVSALAYFVAPLEPLDDALGLASNIDRLYLLLFTEAQRVLREPFVTE